MNATARPKAFALQQDFPSSPALDLLVETLRDRHGDSITAVLFYGSCLRSGDLLDGIVDLYLIVDDYRSFYDSKLQAIANRLLAPNVFYLEIPAGARTLRTKYAVVSVADFQRGVSWRWFHSYIWARFAQPTAIAWCRDTASKKLMQAAQATAVRTFLNRVLPRLPAKGSVQTLWQRGFKMTYAAELRSETASRPAELVAASSDYFCAATRLTASALNYTLLVYGKDEDARYECTVPRLSRFASRFAWPARKIQGKLLSILRLLKALFTFDNGLDYIAWKLQRHSGTRIEIPEKVRRRPLIHVWGFLFQLYRRGLIR